jgi:hypothetical protein
MTAVAVCTLYPRPEGPGFTVRVDKSTNNQPLSFCNCDNILFHR